MSQIPSRVWFPHIVNRDISNLMPWDNNMQFMISNLYSFIMIIYFHESYYLIKFGIVAKILRRWTW